MDLDKLSTLCKTKGYKIEPIYVNRISIKRTFSKIEVEKSYENGQLSVTSNNPSLTPIGIGISFLIACLLLVVVQTIDSDNPPIVVPVIMLILAAFNLVMYFRMKEFKNYIERLVEQYNPV
ncbi:hypothetical protein [Marinomonas balearica]|uniref:Uncharacterized protein n=1 Tax=Marinomonas balearica TaxID=491947 RepID=A0A4V3CH69_9GAMM|nr:hypothetical protein [Marinomonas balearica]TDP00473.1 hypothetical protein DFP79_0282 [Marinomonas balearica]